MMQHQYWVTKKTVLKKLGTKEDECIVSSDAELDSKLELFRSISDSCLQLLRILDNYQDRLCILAQEENALGKFLRDASKEGDAAGKHMLSAGKTISYSGQQRLLVTGPLLRLYHEVETFRGRAIADMKITISAMEKARIEYRAALSWMKSASGQLDPDQGRGIDNFRKAQTQVRESKKVFDKLTLDVLQKIDLLAAARCNMFSHALSNYQSSLLTFSTKVAETHMSTAETMKSAPQYEFSVLKELSQNFSRESDKKDDKECNIEPQDKDQLLFFKDDFKDSKPPKKTEETKLPSNDMSQSNMSEFTIDTLVDIDINTATTSNDNISNDLVGLNLDCSNSIQSIMPSNLMQDFAEFTSHVEVSKIDEKPVAKRESEKKDKYHWYHLFSELDPLGNPDKIDPNTNQNESA